MQANTGANGGIVGGLGILAGVLLGGALGFNLGTTYVTMFMPFAELEGLGPLFLGGLLGAILGGWGGFLAARSLMRRINPGLVIGSLIVLVLLGLVLVRQAASIIGY